MVKITDEDSLREWLKDRLREDAVFIASRAAMRVFPIYWDYALSPLGRKRNLTCMPFLRSLMISSLAAKLPSDEIRAAAANATHAATAIYGANATYVAYAAAAADDAAKATYDAAAVTYTVTYAATAAANFAAAAIWNSVEKDVALLESGGGDAWPKLWPEAEPFFDRLWQAIQAKLSGQESWGFWLDWYQRMLDGEPFPEEYLNLLKDIATRDVAFWGGNDDAVNGRIAEVWEGYKEGKKGAHSHSGEIIETQESVTSVGRHITSLTSQIASFEAYLDSEIREIVGHNAPLTDLDAEAKDALLDILRGVHDKVTEMITALESEQVSTALTVINTKSNEIVEAVEPLEKRETTQDVAAHINLFAAHVKVLTDSGTPGIIASGIAGLEVLRLKAIDLYEKGKVKK